MEIWRIKSPSNHKILRSSTRFEIKLLDDGVTLKTNLFWKTLWCSKDLKHNVSQFILGFLIFFCHFNVVFTNNSKYVIGKKVVIHPKYKLCEFNVNTKQIYKPLWFHLHQLSTLFSLCKWIDQKVFMNVILCSCVPNVWSHKKFALDSSFFSSLSFHKIITTILGQA
jgi:hypothetical protein